jgi:hypothetical protein
MRKRELLRSHSNRTTRRRRGAWIVLWVTGTTLGAPMALRADISLINGSDFEYAQSRASPPRTWSAPNGR